VKTSGSDYLKGINLPEYLFFCSLWKTLSSQANCQVTIMANLAGYYWKIADASVLLLKSTVKFSLPTRRMDCKTNKVSAIIKMY
jgi:hypothetical protein